MLNFFRHFSQVISDWFIRNECNIKQEQHQFADLLRAPILGQIIIYEVGTREIS